MQDKDKWEILDFYSCLISAVSMGRFYEEGMSAAFCPLLAATGVFYSLRTKPIGHPCLQSSVQSGTNQEYWKALEWVLLGVIPGKKASPSKKCTDKFTVPQGRGRTKT